MKLKAHLDSIYQILDEQIFLNIDSSSAVLSNVLNFSKIQVNIKWLISCTSKNYNLKMICFEITGPMNNIKYNQDITRV